MSSAIVYDPPNVEYVIAASNSTTRARRRADFVCGGTGDQSVINSVLAAVGAAGGGKVQIEEGTYEISDTVLIDHSNVQLVGRGRDTVFNVPWVRATPLENPIKGLGLIGSYLENVVVSNLAVIGNANWAENGDDPDGCINVEYNIVYFQFINNLHLENLHLERGGFTSDCRNVNKLYANGLSAYQASGPLSCGKVDGFKVSNISGDDVKLIVDLGESLNGVVTNIHGTATTATSGQHVKGFDCGACNKIALSNFYIKGFDYGIHIKNENTAPSKNIAVSNGIVEGSITSVYVNHSLVTTGDKMGPVTLDSIQVKGGLGIGVNFSGYSDGVSISNSNIDSVSGINAEGTTNTIIAGNTVNSTGGYGIRGGKFSGTEENINLQVINNVVSSSGSNTLGLDAIYLLQCTNPSVINNVVKSSNYHGIYMIQCKSPRVNYNSILSAWAYGILLQWQNDNYLDSTRRALDLQCNGNNIKGWWAQGTGLNQRALALVVSGVTATPHKLGSIADNMIFGPGSTLNGIDYSSSVDLNEAMITDNILSGLAYPIYKRSTGAILTATSTVRNNIGWKTENRGTATVANGATTVVVTHGLASTSTAPTPAAKDFLVTPTNGLGAATKYWISAVTATTFTITVDADPGATTATFVWQARMN